MDRTHRLSVTARDTDYSGSGRGGAGNIAQTKVMQKKLDEKKGEEDAKAIKQARADATAAAEAIQVPKRARAATKI
jgi:hypothetical protein